MTRSDVTNGSFPITGEVDRLSLQVLGRVPGLPELLLDPEAFKNPITLLATVHEKLAAALSFLGDGETLRPEVARQVTPEFLSAVREYAENYANALDAEAALLDRRYEPLKALVREAHSRVPGSPLLAFAELHPSVDWADGPARLRTVEEFFALEHGHRSHLRRLVEPFEFLMIAHDSTGEPRARAIVRALPTTTELLYVPFLRITWSLTCFARGEWPRFPKNFGALLNQVQERLGSRFPSLLDPQAAFFRNAKCHEHWTYVPKNDSVLLWEDKKAPIELETSKLHEKLAGMYTLAGGTVFKVAVSYFLRRVFLETDFLSLVALVVPALADPARKGEADLAFVKWKRAAFRELEQFIGANANSWQPH